MFKEVDENWGFSGCFIKKRLTKRKVRLEK